MDLREQLVKYKEMFEYMSSEQCLPDASTHLIQDIANIYKQINPQYFIDWNCRTCIFNMVKRANNLRLQYLQEQEDAAMLAAKQDMPKRKKK